MILCRLKSHYYIIREIINSKHFDTGLNGRLVFLYTDPPASTQKATLHVGMD